MKLKTLYKEGLLDKLMTGLAKLILTPSYNKKWKELQNDPELKNHKENLERIEKELYSLKNKLKSDKEAVEYLKSIGADMDFLLK